MGQRIVPVRKKTEKIKNKIVKKKQHEPEAAADKSEKKRLAQTTFTPHRGKSGAGFTQDHLQGFNECGKQSLAMSLVPRQSASRRRCRSCIRRDHRWSGGSLRRKSARSRRGGDVVGELRKLRKRLPTRHPFAPTKIAWEKATGANSFANFFLRKWPRPGAPPINVNHRHNPAF